MKKIITFILVLLLQNAFGQKNKEKFLASLEEKRPCEELINREYSQLLIGKWKLSHSLEGNEIIEERKPQKIHFKKNGKFKEVREGEVFKGTWGVYNCPEDELVLRSNRSLLSKKTLKEFEKMGIPKGKKRRKNKSWAYMTIHKITKDTLTTLFYMDLEKEFPRYIFYVREKQYVDCQIITFYKIYS